MADGRIIIDTEIDSKGAEKGISDLSKKAQDGLSTMNKTFLATSAAMGGIGAYAIKVGGDFQEGMSKVSAISGATGDNLKALTEKAKEMGAKTKFSATESAEAMQYMAMAGWKTQDMMNGLPGIMNLAAASGENLGMVSDIVTDALTAFGLQASDSAHFADVLASASNNSNTNVAMLGQSFKYVAPLAGALGYSVEDVSVALGLMANSGIKADSAGTSLRSTLTNMAKPTDSMAIAMEKLGLSLTDNQGNMKSLDTVIGELRTAFSGLSEDQKAQYAATLAGKEGMSGLLAIVNASEEDFNKLSIAINNADGTSRSMADTMNNNLKGSLTLLGSAVEGAGIAFYEKFSGPAKEAVDNVAAWFSDLTVKLGDGELDNTLSLIATSLAAIGTGLLVFNVVSTITNFIGVMKGTATAIGLVAKAQGVWNALVAMSPIGWIAIAIAAVTAGIVVLWNTNEGFRNAVIGAWNSILAAGQVVWGWLVQFFTVDIPNAFQAVIDFFVGIPQWFIDLWNNIKQAFIDGWQAIANFFTVTIPSWIEQIFNWFNELPYKIGYALGYTLAAIIKWGVDTWNYLVTNVPIWIENVVKFFSELPDKLWTWLSNTISKIVQWGQQTYSNMVTAVTNAINAVIQWFSTLPGRVWEWLVNTISKVIQFGRDLGSKASQAGSNMVSNIISAVSNLPSQMAEIGSNIVHGVWNGITGMGSWLAGKVSGFFSGIVDGAKKALGIHSPSRVFRDQVGKYMAQGVGVGFEDESENIQSDMQDSLSNLTAKMQATVDYETSKTSRAMTSRVDKATSNTITNNNDNGITQNVTIVNPERTPAENARALKKAGRDLAFGY